MMRIFHNLGYFLESFTEMGAISQWDDDQTVPHMR